jgi:hypothetical protein
MLHQWIGRVGSATGRETKANGPKTTRRKKPREREDWAGKDYRIVDVNDGVIGRLGWAVEKRLAFSAPTQCALGVICTTVQG